jgi:iron(III) transport system permease protein
MAASRSRVLPRLPSLAIFPASSRQDYPITKAIYELSQLLGDGRLIASALGVWAMCFLGTTMVGASLILGKKLGAIFRV